MVIHFGCVASRINYPSNVTPLAWLQLLHVATDASKPRLLPFPFGFGMVLWLVTGYKSTENPPLNEQLFQLAGFFVGFKANFSCTSHILIFTACF